MSIQRLRFWLPLLFVAALAGAQTEQILKLEPGKQDFKIEDGLLKRGTKAYTINAITVPDLAKPGTPLSAVTPAMNHIAEVGGGAVCFDLYGLSADGKSLAPEGVQAMRQIRQVGEYRGMVGVVRVFGPQAPTDPKARIAAAKTAAEALKTDTQYVYLIEGEDAPKLAAAFRKEAPGLVVIAPKGGQVVISDKESTEEKPSDPVLIKSLPSEIADNRHFILPEGEEQYAALDKLLTDPAELQPWTPDNSGLSEQERADGFLALFDGKTLNGWIVQGTNQKAWQAKDGVLERIDAGSRGLRTTQKFDNYILRFEWNLPNGGNNGVHLHAPRGARASKVGLEYQMMGDHGNPPNATSTGAVYDVVAPTVNAVKPNGEWNTSEITLDGPHLKFVLNDVTVVDVNMDEHEDLKYRLRNGFIVLTEHSATVKYRNVRIKPL